MLVACQSDGTTTVDVTPGIEHLNARPASNVTTVAPGRYGITVQNGLNCCTLQIPQTTSPGKLPLLVMLHGANGTPDQVEQMFAYGDEMGFAVLAPKSANPSWDVIYGGFGVDVGRISAALNETFTRVNVDTKRIALAGFSDGASYSISLGLGNGDLVTHVIAFSPGFMTAVNRIDKPRFFIAHGFNDGVLSYEATSDLFVPFLLKLGYDVTFESFDGGHTVNDAVARKALAWFLQ